MIFSLYEERAYELAKAVKGGDLLALDIAWYEPTHRYTLATMAGHITGAGARVCGYGFNVELEKPYIRFYARDQTR